MIYNLKVLKYRDSTQVQYFTCPIKRTESEDKKKITDDILKKIPIIEDLQRDLLKEKNQEKSLSISVNRSKNNLFRIARSNDWDLFITFTFDQNGRFTHATDSSDYDTVSKAISDWCNLRRKTDCPDLKYLIVPELHKDGIHYHYHGLFANCEGLKLTDSGKTDFEGATIYNVDSWEYGFTTASKIKNNEAVTKYLGKYITKDLMNNLKYKKRYYASQNVKIADEEMYNICPDRLYEFFNPDDMIYLKTVHGGGYNIVKYFEIDKSVDINIDEGL